MHDDPRAAALDPKNPPLVVELQNDIVGARPEAHHYDIVLLRGRS